MNANSRIYLENAAFEREEWWCVGSLADMLLVSMGGLLRYPPQQYAKSADSLYDVT